MKSAKDTETINYAEWAKAVQEAMARSGDEGMSARELADVLNRSIFWTRQALRRLAEAGRVIVVQKAYTDISGRPTMVPAYVLKPQSAPKGDDK